MSYYKFHEDDLFTNTIRSEPHYNFYIWSGSVYVDSIPNLDGTRDTTSDNIFGVPKGFISLFEANIDRPASGIGSGRIYPFVYKDGKRNSLKTMSQATYDTKLPGDQITGSYNMSASISRLFIQSSQTTFADRKRIIALKNTLNHYSYLSPHHQYSSSLGNKGTQDLALISIPSIFYGSSIKKGTVKLDFYITGSLIGRLIDSGSNGELVQVNGLDSANDGLVAGVVLYKEGFIILTGSWSLGGHSTYNFKNALDAPRWYYWGHSGNDGIPTNNTAVSASFYMEYSGTTETQTMTMMAHAKYGEVNYSNNPTSFSASSINRRHNITQAQTGSHQYLERPIKIKNMVSASWTDQEPPFRKTVYISKVGIYDKNKNLIGVAKLAQPIEKTEDLDFTFKIKLDI